MIRLLLLHGASPLDANQCGLSALDRAKKQTVPKEEVYEEKASEEETTEEESHDEARVAMAISACKEMELYLENPIRYRSDCSALIQLSIGLASLDLPVLVMTIISEYLVSINEEKLFGQYPEHKNWEIASLIKKKSKQH